MFDYKNKKFYLILYIYINKKKFIINGFINY